MQIGEILTSEVLGYSQASGNSKLQANVFLKNIFPLLRKDHYENCVFKRLLQLQGVFQIMKIDDLIDDDQDQSDYD